VARAKFLTDEHIANAVAHGLRARGIDVSTATGAKRLGASDPAFLECARTAGRVLITADPDHLRLHAAGIPHAGILFAPADASVGFLIGGAMLIAEVPAAEEMVNNRVEFL
jgi:acyl-coenzyme A thioesterase PaaI-like protein